VIVGSNDSTVQVSSLTDSNGNVYQLAVGPMVTGALSQAILLREEHFGGGGRHECRDGDVQYSG
jgi:hypothetical protein